MEIFNETKLIAMSRMIDFYRRRSIKISVYPFIYPLNIFRLLNKF